MFFELVSKIRRLEDQHQVLFSLIIGVAVVIFWRGVWKLLDQLFLPGFPLLDSVLSIFFSVLILLITNALVRKLL